MAVQTSSVLSCIDCVCFPSESECVLGKRHLKNKLYWNAEPAEKDLQMKWKPIEETIIETIPNILNNNWDDTKN